MPRHNLPGLKLFDPMEKFEPMAGSIYKGVPDHVYHASEGVSKSTLDAIRENPARWKLNKKYPKPDTDAMHVGKAYHCKVLEPHRFDDQFIKSEYDEFRSKEAKDWREEQKSKGVSVLRTNGELPWKASEWDEVHLMAEEVMRHPLAQIFLNPDDLWVELSAYWRDDSDNEYLAHDATGLLCKCRPDAYNTTHEVMIDLKTTTDATLWGFTRSIGDYRYHVASAWYQWGWAKKLGIPCKAFMFIAQEKEPPYPVEIYLASQEDLRVAIIEMFGDLRQFHEYWKSDTWPNTTGQIRTAELAAYQKRAKVR